MWLSIVIESYMEARRFTKENPSNNYTPEALRYLQDEIPKLSDLEYSDLMKMIEHQATYRDVNLMMQSQKHGLKNIRMKRKP